MRSRPSVDGPPECFDYMECHNGGTKTFESDKCWCLCPDTWQGDFDCSKPTRDVTYLEPGSDICKLRTQAFCNCSYSASSPYCYRFGALYRWSVMVAQWENECISLSVLSVARVQLPTTAEYFKGLSLADHMCSSYTIWEDQRP